MELYTNLRSVAAQRVHIALGLKEIDFRTHIVDLPWEQGGAPAPELLARNPQGRVPTLLHGERVLTHSLAIIEYLDELYPDPPHLLPGDARARARVRRIALLIACDIHPLTSLPALDYLQGDWAADETLIAEWYCHWVAQGFRTLEALLADNPATGTYCHSEFPNPTLADICLAPQVAAARAHQCDLSPYPTVRRVVDNCMRLPAFQLAIPGNLTVAR